MNTPHRQQRGITLLESLIALIISAVGVLAIAGTQMRTLVDTQTSLRRAQAVRLIEDLGERMKLNPNALSVLSDYTSGFADTPAAVDCKSSTCNISNLAKYDVYTWKQSVANLLPLGQANIFITAAESGASGQRQLGVMMAWRENTRDDASSSYTDPIDATQVNDSGTIKSGAGSAATCPSGYTCHLQYLPVAARCSPYKDGSNTSYYCPGA